MIVKTLCSVHKKFFGINFVCRAHGIWEASTAFAVSDERGAGGFGRERLAGTITLAHDYSGCPYCGNKTFFKCNQCGQLNCQGTADTSAGRVYVACANCDPVGYLQGQLDSLDAFEDV